MSHSDASRRLFVRTTLGSTAGALASGFGQAPAPPERKMIGIQLGVGPLARPDYERVLDQIQERGGVNTLFVFIFTYIRAWTGIEAGRFRGGNYAIVHPRYYQGTPLRPEDTRATDFGDLDILARLLPAARKRGMKTFCWVIEDNAKPKLPNIDALWERDFYGRPGGNHPAGPCSNNPGYRNFLLGLFEDYTRSYEIDGLMWGSERQGPFGNALGAFHGGGTVDPGRVTCFCEFCERKASRQGIRVERAKQGFRELEKFVKAGRAGQRPIDGYYVTLWRILLRYPEILAWEMFWTDAIRETCTALYEKVKSIRPELPVGWHIWHNNSFHPIYRAEQDYRAMSAYSDFIKPVLYSNCAGARMASYLDSVGANFYGDLPKEQLLEFEYRVMNYREGACDRIPLTGFSADYVFRETKRACDSVTGTKTRVWPGIDIDVPTGQGQSKCTPESVREAVFAVFRAGADGILLSRNYTEMKPENLAAAGKAIRELGLA